MPEQFPINPDHERHRRLLRRVGPILLGVAALFFVVSVGDIACTMMSHHHEPTLMWLWFLMIPTAVAGGAMTQAGYAGKMTRFYAQELTPPVVDTIKYAAEGTRESVRQIAGAIGEGLKDVVGDSGNAAVRIRCHKCNHENEMDAKFCSNCGAALTKSRACPSCKELNDPDARFCDNCGQAMSG